MIIHRVAIIGLGSIGKRHLRLLTEVRPDIEIIVMRSGYGSVCDEERLATDIVHSIDDVIRIGVQAAIISSPATFHLNQALQLGSSGIHILIEKPISDTSKNINDLLETVKSERIVAMVGYVLRHDPGAIKFKHYLDNVINGSILHARIECGSYLPDWRLGKDYRATVSARLELGGGALLELSHELDYLHWFFGRPVDIQAIIRNSGTLDINVEDQADLLITSGQGYPISVQIDFNRRYAKRKCNVQTTEGELTWDAVRKNVTWESVNEETIEYEYNTERDDIYRTQLQHFLDCIENDNQPLVTVDDGIDVIRLIDSARNADAKSSKVLL